MAYVDRLTPGLVCTWRYQIQAAGTDGSAGYALTTNGSGTLSFNKVASTDSFMWSAVVVIYTKTNTALNVGSRPYNMDAKLDVVR